MLSMKNDVAILITTFCGDPKKELKEYMTEKLCENLHNTTDYYTCLVSHSPISQKTQQYCNSFLYDSDNRFQFDGLPDCQESFWIAELTSIHNGLNYLKSKGFNKFIKITYDCDPTIDFNRLIQSCLSVEKPLVSAKFQNLSDAIGTFIIMSDIDLFKEVLPLEDYAKYNTFTEWLIYKSLNEKNLLHKVHLEPGYDNFFGLNINQYSFCGGKEFYREYTF